MKNKSEYEANNHQNKPLSVDMNLSYPLPKSFMKNQLDLIGLESYSD